MSLALRTYLNRTTVLIFFFLLSLLAASILETIFIEEILPVKKDQFYFSPHASQETSPSLNVKTYRLVMASKSPLSVVLLIHGFSSSSQMMEPLALQLARKGFFVVSYDLVGHGKSRGFFILEDSPQLTLSLALQAREIVAFVMEKERGNIVTNEIAVVGHSLGANIALMLGILEPKLVKAVVAIGALDISFSAEYKLNATVPRNVLVIHGSLDQLVDEQTTLRYFDSIFPNSTSDHQRNQEWGDMSAGTGRKYSVVFCDHVMLVLHPDVHKLVAEWISKSFSLDSSQSSDDELVGLMLVGIYYLVMLVKSVALLLIFSTTPLLLGWKIFPKYEVVDEVKSEIMNENGREQQNWVKRRKKRLLLLIVFVETISFILSVLLTYYAILALIQLKMRLVSMAFAAIFWTFLSVTVLPVTFTLLNVLPEKKAITLWVRSVFRMTCRKESFFYMLVILLAINVTVIGLEMSGPWVDSRFLIVSIQILPVERLISLFLILAFVLLRVEILYFFFNKILFERREWPKSILLTMGLLASVLLAVGLLAVLVPSFFLPSANKVGVLFFAATFLFSLTLSFIVSMIFVLMVMKVLSLPASREYSSFFPQVTIFLFSFVHSLVLASLYPILG